MKTEDSTKYDLNLRVGLKLFPNTKNFYKNEEAQLLFQFVCHQEQKMSHLVEWDQKSICVPKMKVTECAEIIQFPISP